MHTGWWSLRLEVTPLPLLQAPWVLPTRGWVGAEGKLPVTQELSTSCTRFVHTHTHTHTHPTARELFTVLTGREAFSTPARRAWAQSWFSIEQRLRAGPLKSLKVLVKYTQHKIYPLSWFEYAVQVQSRCTTAPSVPRTLSSSQVDRHAIPITHTHPAPGPAPTFCLCG